MSLNEEVEILRRVPLFARIEPSKLKLIAFTSERMTFEKDEVLFRQGDMGDAAYIVLQGDADVLVNSQQGQIRVAGLGQNDIVGEIAILIDVPRTATVRACSRLVTLRITKELFFRLITEFPQIAVEIMRELAIRLEKTTGDLRDAVTRNASAQQPAGAGQER
ncbi:CRP/FNR family cyclic AMP-dependent transcriptional regulator [Constrictibacter sp. MBR-5]|jgi:CRP-like cAMP-binding protein|uniref:cyclic nucleotide-binding domain-containing protein n=1 Tax=Constrictibacter sp. MBR-5 TaxID=3156467 RepID=UPI003390ED4C